MRFDLPLLSFSEFTTYPSVNIPFGLSLSKPACTLMQALRLAFSPELVEGSARTEGRERAAAAVASITLDVTRLDDAGVAATVCLQQPRELSG